LPRWREFRPSIWRGCSGGSEGGALGAARQDPQIAPHLDPRRLGVAGFSLGGFTALLTAGARADIDPYLQFCHDNPHDPTCMAQAER